MGSDRPAIAALSKGRPLCGFCLQPMDEEHERRRARAPRPGFLYAGFCPRTESVVVIEVARP